MSEIQLSKLVKVPLRKVWKHEALDFVQWLALPENIQALSEVIEIELNDAKPEVGVGKRADRSDWIERFIWRG